VEGPSASSPAGRAGVCGLGAGGVRVRSLSVSRRSEPRGGSAVGHAGSTAGCARGPWPECGRTLHLPQPLLHVACDAARHTVGTSTVATVHGRAPCAGRAVRGSATPRGREIGGLALCLPQEDSEGRGAWCCHSARSAARWRGDFGQRWGTRPRLPLGVRSQWGFGAGCLGATRGRALHLRTVESKANVMSCPGFTKPGPSSPNGSYSYMYFLTVSFLLLSGL